MANNNDKSRRTFNLSKINIYSKNFYKKHGALKSWLAIFFTSFVSMLIIIFVSLNIIINYVILGNLTHKEIDTKELGISQSAKDTYDGKDIINIMLYGIDSRDMEEKSRSDSIMLLTVDKKNTKIKMTSIARDTYVDILGYGKDKLNHAFIYGWVKENDITGGVKLSLKTINNAFNLNVSEYVTCNFWALSTIIDFIGGVEIDVDSAERYDINTNYIPYLQQMGIDCELITQNGMQHLTGGQAVAYCRVRHVGGDVMRGERHREVIMAMFDKVKRMSFTKQLELVNLVLKECTTSLSNSEIVSLGTWAIRNMGSLKFENLGLPTSDIDKGGTMMNGVWYYTYDLEKAAQKIEEFILEKEVTQATVSE